MSRSVVDRIVRVDESHFALIDRPDTRTTYEGRTDTFVPAPDTSKPNWQIKRTTYTNGVWETTFADHGKYNCVWDDRASYFTALVGPNPAPETVPVTGVMSFVGLHNGGRVTEVTLSDTVWTELPTTPLADRNAISIQNSSLSGIKLNYDPLIPGYVGVELSPGAERMYAIQDDIPIYAKAAVNGAKVTIEELS